MCGISGIVDRNPHSRIEEERLLAMRDSMFPRGPDDAGIWMAPGIGLGHRRLSILDLSEAGHQPMVSEQGRYVITYNGEIYNCFDLREALRREGFRFHSRTDTEVVLKGFERWGLERLLEKLNGIFAFAIWDSQERELILARDRFGVKPLHWAVCGNQFLFASEIKALFQAGLERKFNASCLEELLLFRFVAGPDTSFCDVRRLLPGHYLIWNEGEIREVSYYSILDHLEGKPTDPFEWYEAFSDSVRSQKMGDVPIGTLLSGGIDSSAVTAELSRQLGRGLMTFTVSPEGGFDESRYAQQVADRWGCQSHHLQVPAEGIFEQFFEAQRFQDEPLAHGNEAHLLAISRLAQDYVKVLLSGEGADETLAGYVRYQPLRFSKVLTALLTPFGAPARWIGGRLGYRARKFARFLSLKSVDDYVLFNSADVLPADLERIGLRPNGSWDWRRQVLKRVRTRTPSPLRAVMLYDLQTFLPSLLDRNDRMTMAASIECRVPFLDHHLVEKAFRIPESELFLAGYGKKPLRCAVRGMLPGEVLRRPKWGFGVPCLHYLRSQTEGLEFLTGLLKSNINDVLNIPNLRFLIRDFLEGDDSFVHVIRQVFFIGLWWELIVLGKGSNAACRSAF